MENLKVKVIDTNGLSEKTISKIEETMIYLGMEQVDECMFCKLKNSKNEQIMIFPERIIKL